MELVDCHTHTIYSDGGSTLDENIAAAEARGLTTIACTDHFAHPAFMDCAVDESRIAELGSRIEQARLSHPNIDIVFGWEADWYEGCERDIPLFKAGATFLLGSVHYLGEFAIDWSEDMRIWDAEGTDEVWRRYAQAWCRACFCPVGFDSMAHPDLPRLFENEGYAPSLDLDPLWDDMAEAAHESHVRIELSTAGLRKSVRDFYPAFELLKRFRAAGVPLTVGSDAHSSKDIGYGIKEAYACARRAGYASIDVPTSSGEWRRAAL